MSVYRLPVQRLRLEPNTGGEIGWCIALERDLAAAGWDVRNEVPTGQGGVMDIVAIRPGTTMVIEVKGSHAGPSAVSQIMRYLNEFDAPDKIGVIAAPTLGASISELPPDVYFLPLERAR